MVGPKYVRDGRAHLAKNFETYLEEYKKSKEQQKTAGRIQDLKNELKSTQDYLDLYYSNNGSSICDTAENISFQEHKISILRKILSQ